MKKFKKILAMGMIMVVAISSMSLAAQARELIYDDDGNLIGYVIQEQDIDKDVMINKIAATPLQAAYSNNPPSYNNNVRDLTDGDYVEPFSIAANGIKYSNPWTGSGSVCGVLVQGVNALDMDNISIKVYQFDTSGNATLKHSKNFAEGDIGIVYLNFSSSKQYYLLLDNNARTSYSGHTVITNSPEDYGLYAG